MPVFCRFIDRNRKLRQYPYNLNQGEKLEINYSSAGHRHDLCHYGMQRHVEENSTR